MYLQFNQVFEIVPEGLLAFTNYSLQYNVDKYQTVNKKLYEMYNPVASH